MARRIILGLVAILVGCNAKDSDDYINWEDSMVVKLLNNIFSDANADNPCSSIGGPVRALET